MEDRAPFSVKAIAADTLILVLPKSRAAKILTADVQKKLHQCASAEVSWRRERSSLIENALKGSKAPPRVLSINHLAVDKFDKTQRSQLHPLAPFSRHTSHSISRHLMYRQGSDDSKEEKGSRRRPLTVGVAVPRPRSHMIELEDDVATVDVAAAGLPTRGAFMSPKKLVERWSEDVQSSQLLTDTYIGYDATQGLKFELTEDEKTLEASLRGPVDMSELLPTIQMTKEKSNQKGDSKGSDESEEVEAVEIDLADSASALPGLAEEEDMEEEEEEEEGEEEGKADKREEAKEAKEEAGNEEARNDQPSEGPQMATHSHDRGSTSQTTNGSPAPGSQTSSVSNTQAQSVSRVTLKPYEGPNSSTTLSASAKRSSAVTLGAKPLPTTAIAADHRSGKAVNVVDEQLEKLFTSGKLGKPINAVVANDQLRVMAASPSRNNNHDERGMKDVQPMGSSKSEAFLTLSQLQGDSELEDLANHASMDRGGNASSPALQSKRRSPPSTATSSPSGVPQLSLEELQAMQHYRLYPPVTSGRNMRSKRSNHSDGLPLSPSSTGSPVLGQQYPRLNQSQPALQTASSARLGRGRDANGRKNIPPLSSRHSGNGSATSDRPNAAIRLALTMMPPGSSRGIAVSSSPRENVPQDDIFSKPSDTARAHRLGFIAPNLPEAPTLLPDDAEDTAPSVRAWAPAATPIPMPAMKAEISADKPLTKLLFKKPKRSSGSEKPVPKISLARSRSSAVTRNTTSLVVNHSRESVLKRQKELRRPTVKTLSQLDRRIKEQASEAEKRKTIRTNTILAIEPRKQVFA